MCMCVCMCMHEMSDGNARTLCFLSSLAVIAKLFVLAATANNASDASDDDLRPAVAGDLVPRSLERFRFSGRFLKQKSRVVCSLVLPTL